MYYRLSENYQLRGWQHLTGVLTDQFGRQVSVLSAQMFSLLMICDGETSEDMFPEDEESQNQLKGLLEKGWIQSFDSPNPVLPRQRYQYFDNRYVDSILWSITGKCNFRCRHCYMDAPNAQLGELPFEQIKDIIDQLADCGVSEIHMTGGEPFVRKDFWDIVEYLMSKDMFVGKIYTNGWLLNDSVLAKFRELRIHPPISISFDGLGWHDWMRGVPGAEERAVQALKICIEDRIPVDVELCLHKGNRNALRETINFLASIGVPALKIGTVQETPLWLQHCEGYALSKEEYFETAMDYIPHFYEDKPKMLVHIGSVIMLYPGRKTYRICAEKSTRGEELACRQYLCGAARFSAYISPEGRFLPCMPITSCDEQKQFPLIRDIGVKQCMSDSYYMNFVGNRVEDLLKRNEKCGACQYRYRCCGGCRAIAMLANNGDLYASDPEACFLYENGYVDRFRQIADEAIAKYCKEDT